MPFLCGGTLSMPCNFTMHIRHIWHRGIESNSSANPSWSNALRVKTSCVCIDTKFKCFHAFNETESRHRIATFERSRSLFWTTRALTDTHISHNIHPPIHILCNLRDMHLWRNQPNVLIIIIICCEVAESVVAECRADAIANARREKKTNKWAARHININQSPAVERRAGECVCVQWLN